MTETSASQPVSVLNVYRDVEMLPGCSVAHYLEECKQRHPRLFARLDLSRGGVAEVDALYAGLGRASTHFESKLDGGRGDAYRAAQNVDYRSRARGFLRILDLATAGAPNPAGLVVLDSLGGNGTMTRIVSACRPLDTIPYIVTNDASARMIESAWAQGLPAIRQPLQNLMWFRDCAFDAVIVAYGTHHIPSVERATAIAEAYRVLRPGGRVLLQDFEIGCPTTHWYSDTLHRYTQTGHEFDYFKRSDFERLLTTAGFRDVETLDVYDPIIAYGDTANAARVAVLRYVLTLFALDKMVVGDKHDDDLWHRLEAVVRESSTFDPGAMPPDAKGVSEFYVGRDGERFRAEIPRIALAGSARRPE